MSKGKNAPRIGSGSASFEMIRHLVEWAKRKESSDGFFAIETPLPEPQPAELARDAATKRARDD